MSSENTPDALLSDKSIPIRDRLIFALDVPGPAEATSLPVVPSMMLTLPSPASSKRSSLLCSTSEAPRS